MRTLALVAGVLLLACGVLFALQGAGIVMWPAESFMLASRIWVAYGMVIGAAGGFLIRWSRRR